MSDAEPLVHDRRYFDAMYEGDPDPWGFESSWYEQRKFALTVAALPRVRYRRAFEPGCANGALSERLADRCEALIATDIVPAVVERAQRRMAGVEHVDVTEASFPEWWPDGSGDLIVLSEIAYYLTDRGLTLAEERLAHWLEPEGDLVTVHYTGATDYPRTGRAVGRWLDGLHWLERRTTLVDERFELGVWRRRRATTGA